MHFERSKAMQRRAHELIPGGAHTYAKGDDQFPELAPGFIARGKGCHIWDVDGNEYIEYAMGLRSVTLGHAYEPVVAAAARQMQLGENFNRPAAIELECAEKLASLIDSAEMVKFAKNGSDVTTAAVKLARAFTGRDMVAICGDHPFFSTDDWFIGSTGIPGGIPQRIRELTVKFQYNNLASVAALFAQYPGQIACLVLELERTDPPADGFLHKLKELCHANGALLIADEIVTGFRWHLRGAQHIHQIKPDLSTFGKAVANGFALAALVGRRDVMELGGIFHQDRERVFLLSTTYGAETHTLAAALEVMRIYEQEQVVESLYRQGERLRKGVNEAIAEHNLEGYFEISGRPCLLMYGTRDQERKPSQPFRTLFLQETIRRGILAPSFVVSYSHSDADIDRTIDAVGEALYVYRRALDEGVEKYLVGPAVRPVYRAYN